MLAHFGEPGAVSRYGPPAHLAQVMCQATQACILLQYHYAPEHERVADQVEAQPQGYSTRVNASSQYVGCSLCAFLVCIGLCRKMAAESYS